MKRAIVAFMLAASAPAVFAQEPGAWTRARIDSMSSEELIRQLFGGLSTMLVPDLRHNRLYSRGRLRRLQFYSRPRVSHTAGLCESDWVWVEFAAAELRDPSNTDVPMRPRQISARPGYIIRDLGQVLRIQRRTLEDQTRWDTDCAAIDPNQATRIIAHNPADVTLGLRLVASVAEAAREGRLAVTLDCSGLQRERRPTITESECLAELGAIRPEEVIHTAAPRETASGVIRYIDTRTKMLTFHFAPGETLPSNIQSYRAGIPLPLRISVSRLPDPPIAF